jgi:hypothetical protein
VTVSKHWLTPQPICVVYEYMSDAAQSLVYVYYASRFAIPILTRLNESI